MAHFTAPQQTELWTEFLAFLAQNAAKKKGLPWTQAKGFDTSLPHGAFIPASIVPDPHKLTLWCSVNGEETLRVCACCWISLVSPDLLDLRCGLQAWRNRGGRLAIWCLASRS